MNQLMTGAIAMAFAVAALFFFRFWRNSRDRLFALFALSFLVLAVNRVAIGVANDRGDHGDYFYWVRAIAFGIILVAILDKNRSGTSRAQPCSGAPDSKH